MIDYTKEELVELLRKNPEKFNEWKVEQEEIDLSEVDFSGINLSETDFSGIAIAPGVETGKFDIGMNIVVSEERNETGTLSDVYYTCPVYLVILGDSPYASAAAQSTTVAKVGFFEKLQTSFYRPGDDADAVRVSAYGYPCQLSDLPYYKAQLASWAGDHRIRADVGLLPDDFSILYCYVYRMQCVFREPLE